VVTWPVWIFCCVIDCAEVANAGEGGGAPWSVRREEDRALMVNTIESAYNSVMISRQIQNAVVFVRCCAGCERNSTHMTAPHMCVSKTVSSVRVIICRIRSFVRSNDGERERQRQHIRIVVRRPSSRADRPIQRIVTTWEGIANAREECAHA
jgi:hypothetical protein